MLAYIAYFVSRLGESVDEWPCGSQLLMFLNYVTADGGMTEDFTEIGSSKSKAGVRLVYRSVTSCGAMVEYAPYIAAHPFFWP